MITLKVKGWKPLKNLAESVRRLKNYLKKVVSEIENGKLQESTTDIEVKIIDMLNGAMKDIDEYIEYIQIATKKKGTFNGANKNSSIISIIKDLVEIDTLYCKINENQRTFPIRRKHSEFIMKIQKFLRKVKDFNNIKGENDNKIPEFEQLVNIAKNNMDLDELKTREL